MFRPHQHVRARPDLPRRVRDGASALVVGGGIAGVTAALVLAERGVSVELLEAADHLGGRLGTWDRRLPDGSSVVVEHGYHGFFRQYYTLRDVLARIDPSLGFLRDVGGYPIESREWAAEDFTDLPTAPLLNLAALVWKSPSFRLGDLRHVDAREALEMLRYDPVATFAAHDERSAAQLLDALGFSDRGRAMLFEVFAHSFFNLEQRYSAAEFLAMCHFYFTGNPEGLGMDAPVDDYRTTLWDPLTWRLSAHGASVTCGARVTAIRPSGASSWTVSVDGEPERTARHLVLATDVPGTRALVESSPALAAAAPDLARRVAALPGGEPYVVARLFCDGDVDPSRAVFTGVTREAVLDSVTSFHRLEAGSARWAGRTGSVLELHSYACPPGASCDELVATMRAELRGLWPETADLTVLDVDAHRYTNAPGFDPGFHTVRPGVLTDARGVRLAGDWVASDVPSALMERAAVTAVTAANDVLREEGAGPEPIRSIRPRGLLAGRRRPA